MRGWTLVVLGAVILAPFDGAGVEGPPCVPTCDVSTSQFANAPPIVALGAGATITWSSGDGARHTATSKERCLDVSILRDAPGSVSFAARDGVLWALDPVRGEEACAEAVAADGKAHALTYRCTIHPALQQGALVVLVGQS